MQIKIKKLHEDAVIPTYARKGDAAQDLTSVSKRDVDNGDHGYTEYGTGLSIEVPEGYVGLIFPRSSISNTGHILANAVGVIDSGYRGEVSLRFKTIPGSKEYAVGERVGQLMILPYQLVTFEEVDELESTDRGTGGFGSTN